MTAVLDRLLPPPVEWQPPTLQLAPIAPGSAAEDAIAIYEHCGQHLDEWQEMCLRIGCGVREDLNWASFENGVIVARQNGKGAIIEALLLASLFIWGNRKTIYAAHRGDTVQTMLNRVKALINDTPDLLRRCKPINPSDEHIELIGGARLEFRTRTASGGRGLTGDLVILDEALELNIDQITALVPVLTAIPFAQLWYFSTVPKYGDAHLCGVRERVLAKAPGLSWAEWSNPAGTKLDDPKARARANPALNIRIMPERLDALWGILGDEGFATECMSIWPKSTFGQLLDHKRWKRWAGDGGMYDPESHRAEGAEVIMSLDMNPMRDFGTIGMWSTRADGLEHLQVLSHAPGVEWMVPRAAELNATVKPALWVIDAKNGVSAFVDELRRVGIKLPADPKCADCIRREASTCRKHPATAPLRRGDLLVLDMDMMGVCVGQFVDAFRRDPSIFRHIGQESFNSAVENVKARPIGDQGQIGWARRTAAVDIGPVVSVSAARYGHGVWVARQGKMVPKSKVW